jgi:hypothetical protein
MGSVSTEEPGVMAPVNGDKCGSRRPISNPADLASCHSVDPATVRGPLLLNTVPYRHNIILAKAPLFPCVIARMNGQSRIHVAVEVCSPGFAELDERRARLAAVRRVLSARLECRYRSGRSTTTPPSRCCSITLVRQCPKIVRVADRPVLTGRHNRLCILQSPRGHTIGLVLRFPDRTSCATRHGARRGILAPGAPRNRPAPPTAQV